MSKLISQANLFTPLKNSTRLNFEQMETFGTIVEKATDLDGIYSLDSLVENENNRYWLRMIGFAIDEPDRDRYLSNLKEYTRQREVWNSPRTIRVHFVGTRNLSLKDCEPKIHAIKWNHDSSCILERLNPLFADNNERRQAVLFAETIAFHDNERRQLLEYLGDFISKHRFAIDEDTLTIMGAAIRKFALNMAESDFEAYAQWLRPTDTQTIRPHIELEMAKALVSRLSYENVAEGEAFPELIAAVSTLARDYIFAPRRVLQDNFASIALNAILAVAILDAISNNDRKTSEILDAAKKLRIEWFLDLVLSRIDDAAIAIETRNAAVAQRLRSVRVAAA